MGARSRLSAEAAIIQGWASDRRSRRRGRRNGGRVPAGGVLIGNRHSSRSRKMLRRRSTSFSPPGVHRGVSQNPRRRGRPTPHHTSRPGLGGVGRRRRARWAGSWQDRSGLDLNQPVRVCQPHNDDRCRRRVRFPEVPPSHVQDGGEVLPCGQVHDDPGDIGERPPSGLDECLDVLEDLDRLMLDVSLPDRVPI